MARQRWFGGKSQEVAGARVLETAPIVAEPPVLVSALVEVRFGAGTHEVYQLLLGLAADGERPVEEVVERVDGQVAHDALGDPEHVAAIARLIRSSAALPAGEGEMVFRNTAGAHAYGFEAREVRPIGVEQSNTSFVLDERLVLKAYRRVEAGVNPELELLRFLTDHGFPNVPGLVGWYGYTGPLMEATLGVLQRYVPDARDGWALVQGMLQDGDPEPFVPMAGRLGEVTGAMHAALASDASDPAFAPAEPSAEAVAILAARIDDEVVELFANLPDLPVLAPIAGSGEAVRERVRRLPAALSGGRIIRQHGDYHLGQVLWAGGDWVVIDFEGEPARPITERRRKRSPAARRRRHAALVRLRGCGLRAAHRPDRGAGLARARARGLPVRLPGAGRRHGPPAAEPGGDGGAAAHLRAREGGLRAALRARAPAGMGRDRRGRHPGPDRVSVPPSRTCACCSRGTTTTPTACSARHPSRRTGGGARLAPRRRRGPRAARGRRADRDGVADPAGSSRPSSTAPAAARVPLEVRFPDGGVLAYDDPYAFPPTLGELDLHLLGEGRHEEL